MFKQTTFALLTIVLVVGCAKEKSYDKVYKEVEQLKKSDIKITKKVSKSVKASDGTTKTIEEEVPVKYMYVPMTMGTPREVVEAKPFYQGDEKVVRLEWSKEGLEVLEIEKDERFNDNPLNDLPVLTIPGEYNAYKCSEDEFGDCTNKEEVDTELEWDQKPYFYPNYADLKEKELNFLDVLGVEGSGCVSLQSTRVVDYEISDGVINIELEKAYKLNNSLKCIWNNYVNDKLSYNSFSVRSFYSLVELEQLVTKDYEPVVYPIPDHSEFGFFKNSREILNDDFDSRRKEQEFLLNRWAPQRKNNELVYYLSSNFTKPENKVLLNATHKAINIINSGLNKGNVPFRIKLIEQEYGKKEVSPGDLRYNTIVLIEDPLANGLLGYGPSVSNPYTGEIIQAHTNMYGGVLKSMTRRVYNNASDLSKEQLATNKAKDMLVKDIKVTQEALAGLSPLPDSITAQMATAVVGPKSKEQEVANVSAVQNIEIDNHQVHSRLENVDLKYVEKKLARRMQEQVNSRAILAQLGPEQNSELTEFERRFHAWEDKKFGNEINHKHEPEFFPIGGTTKAVYPDLFKISGILDSDGSLKRWDDLNDFQKQRAQEIILESSWISTLIHEFGHNLGLRHNFSGSTDSENFLTDAEAQELGMQQAPAYSSVMDYSFSEFNQLKSLGKYDVAALRFAYAREVEVGENDILKVTTSLSDLDKKLEAQGKARKAYAFCTDENAGLSSLCNRFDEGTTLTEIAKFRIKRYKDMYKYRNFRDGRLDFSAYDVPNYFFYRKRELGQIRDILEEYEFFVGIFGKELMAAGCSPQQTAQYPICKTVNDYKQAVELVGDFFVEILKTPDHLCALAKPTQPKVIVEYRKLFDIYDNIKFNIDHVTKTCFDQAVKDKVAEDNLIVIGETGKFLNGFKDTNPNYKYVTDRAVLGVWPDKVIALRKLFDRRWRNRSTDDAHMALMDIPAIRNKVIKVVNHFILGDRLAEPVPFTMEDGKKFQVPYIIGNDNHIEQLQDVFGWMKSYVNLNHSGRTNMIDTMMKQVREVGVYFGVDSYDDAYFTSNLFAVRKERNFSSEQDRFSQRAYYFDGKDTLYSAGKEITPVAYFMISAIVEKEQLDKVDKKLLVEVLKLRTNPDAPEELSDNHKIFFGLAKNWHDLLIQNAQQGTKLPEQAFVQTFGKEVGPKVYSVYNEGFEVMQEIVELKNKIMTTPRNETEKMLFEVSVDLLGGYLSGTIDDQFVDYMKNQLKRLPMYKAHPDF
ncbi:MAG: zinc-dependent metalloprotease [Bacteriovoracaceae bacterium]|nr:zinc-dependent metalloprotease [Bacteriovoracaceae bacterium]